jgi:hypothetical protein
MFFGLALSLKTDTHSFMTCNHFNAMLEEIITNEYQMYVDERIHVYI